MAWAMAKKENHMGFMSKLLSFGSDKDLKRYYKIVDQINGLEPQFEKMTEEELRGQTDKFRERYANGESLDDMLPEAFATVAGIASRRLYRFGRCAHARGRDLAYADGQDFCGG